MAMLCIYRKVKEFIIRAGDVRTVTISKQGKPSYIIKQA